MTEEIRVRPCSTHSPLVRYKWSSQDVRISNPVTDNKILPLPNLKAYKNYNVTQNICLSENIVGKGENAGYQHCIGGMFDL